MAWEVIKQFKSKNVAVNVSMDEGDTRTRFSIQCGVIFNNDNGRIRPFIPVHTKRVAVGRVELSDIFERLDVCLDAAQSFITKEAKAIEDKRVEHLVERDTERERMHPTPRRKQND